MRNIPVSSIYKLRRANQQFLLYICLFILLYSTHHAVADMMNEDENLPNIAISSSNIFTNIEDIQNTMTVDDQPGYQYYTFSSSSTNAPSDVASFSNIEDYK